MVALKAPNAGPLPACCAVQEGGTFLFHGGKQSDDFRHRFLPEPTKILIQSLRWNQN
jgi:hypothetical protein